MQLPEFLKSRFFWLNLIAILILVITFAVDNSLFTGMWVSIAGLIIVVLNAIVGMIKSQEVKALKAKLSRLESK
jgi:hypothetical protein